MAIEVGVELAIELGVELVRLVLLILLGEFYQTQRHSKARLPTRYRYVRAWLA